MKVSMHDGGVPFVVTYRKILRKPKVKRERRFVGPIQLVKNILVKAIETLEGVAFETRHETIDPGQSVSVHWAVTIPDAFDTTTGREKSLMAFRMLDDMPPCGAHFEIISPPSQAQHEEHEQSTEGEIESPSAPPPDISPEQFEMLARQRRQQTMFRGGINGQGFRRPADPAYAPRPVRTIEEEAGTEQDEEPEDLGRSSRLGEDD